MQFMVVYKEVMQQHSGYQNIRNNNYLIYLYADLDKWKVRLDLVNKDYSSFYEPDLDNQLTAIALQDDGRMFKKLKLVRE